MLSLTKRATNKVVIDGKRYHLTLYYNCVLQAFQILGNKLLKDEEKAMWCCTVLVRNDVKKKDSEKVCSYILKNFLTSENKQGSDDTTKIFDFEQDEKYIFSSFYQAYGIDLIKMADKLSWDKFIALLDGLPENTKLKEVMSIRARKIPQATKYNTEEIANLRKLKSIYALQYDDEEISKNYNNGMARLFETLKQRAVKK